MIPVGVRVVGCLIVACVVCLGVLASSVLAQSVPATCLPRPLPMTPRPPVYSGNAAWTAADQMRFEVWREPCTDGSGQVATLLKVTPLSGVPFVCSSQFTVIQGGIQYAGVRLPQASTDESGDFCGNVFIPTSVIITQHFYVPQFDDLQAFTLIYEGAGTGFFRLEVGAHGAETPPPILQKPVFIYPVNGQILGYAGSYLFQVQPITNAQGFLWGFFQNGMLVWENLRDEGILSSNEYGIHPGTTAHSRFVPGRVEVWVRALINGQWTDATVIAIYLQ